MAEMKKALIERSGPFCLCARRRLGVDGEIETLTPALSQREREPTESSCAMHRPERSMSIMDSVVDVQVNESLEFSTIGPLSLWERARVRGF
jgi:hypothetical protein